MREHDSTTSGWSGFLAELRRRHVVRFSLGYAAAAFVALQLAEIVFPAFGIGETGVRVLVVVVALGFPPAAALAWIYDLTRHGLRRTERQPEGRSLLPRVAFLALTLGIVGSLWIWLDRQDLLTAAPAVEVVAAYDPSRPIRSLAVLPLDDFSEDGGREYFTAGMHEELITQLSQILSGLRVVSRTTSARYAGTELSVPEIGRELGVDAIVEGSVIRSGDRVRITVQLIHAPSDTHIWAHRYERALGDLLALQQEVAHDIAHSIREELAPEVETALRTTDRGVAPEVEEAYLRGLHEYARGTSEGYRLAMEAFEAALDADSSFAPALAGLAGARFLLGTDAPGDAEGEMEKARTEAVRALELDSGSVEAREVLALIGRSMPSAGSSPTAPTAVSGTTREVYVPKTPGMPDSIVIDRAALDSAWAFAMTRLGERIEEQGRRGALAAGADARARASFAARQLIAAGRHEEAARLLQEAVGASSGSVELQELLVRAQVAAGDVGGAAESVRRWATTGRRGAPSEQSATELERAVASEGARGYWRWTLARLERRAQAGNPAPPTELAAAHAALGNTEEAFGHLYRALERGDRTLLTVRSDPAFDPLRGDRRFSEIARRIQALRWGPRGAPPDPR